MTAGEGRDDAEVPAVGIEVEVEAVEGQDEDNREDYEPEEGDRNLLLKDGLLGSITKKSDIEWRRTPYTPVNSAWEIPVPEHPKPLTPYEYFQQYVPRNAVLSCKWEENLSIDEQIVPFRGKLSVLQYVKGKPEPWGVKVYFLCGKSGLAYDFLIYQGATTELSDQSKKILGHGAAVVTHLCQRIQNPNHKLFFDNFFTTYNVLEVLSGKNIQAAGTARVCRFATPPLKAEMSKKGRGSHDEVRSRDGKVVLVKWFDN
ncbi:hypothetical protein ACEWY4_028046 [Coilia grayii]|uniref:PiggyBac transposable element-derived protein domain-containing protein n=1 Tax=Coilia grayii TaxID=363190 RepID=A0ABD1IQ62_9TELE